MQYTKNNHAIVISAEIYTAVAIGEAPQPLKNMIPGRSSEIDLGNPCNLGGKVCQEFLGVVRAALGNVTPNSPQIFNREGSDYQAFRIDGLSFRSSRR